MLLCHTCCGKASHVHLTLRLVVRLVVRLVENGVPRMLHNRCNLGIAAGLVLGRLVQLRDLSLLAAKRLAALG